MRFVLVLLLMGISAAPALAQYWTQYANSRFGYSLDIPPGYVGQGESDNGDGQAFFEPGTTQTLIVWGGWHVLGDFEEEVRLRLSWAEEDAWNVTSKTVTPDWAEFTAIKGMRMLHQRMISGCGGSAYAAYALDYLVVDTAKIDEIIEGLAPTFQPPSNC
jgi:hypothetical protein